MAEEQDILGNNLAELGELLSRMVESVVHSQEKLDAYTEARKAAYESAEDSSLVIPPLWYTFERVALELELSAMIQQISTEVAPGVVEERSQLVCRTLNPTMVGLHGYEASAGMRVHVQMGLRGVLPAKVAPSTAADPDDDTTDSEPDDTQPDSPTPEGEE